MKKKEVEAVIHLYLGNVSFHSKRFISKKSHIKRMLEDIYEKAKRKI